MMPTIFSSKTRARIWDLLGLKETPGEATEITRMIEVGIPVSAMEHLKQRAGLTSKQLAEATAIPGRTLSRRLHQAHICADELLNRSESDRVYRLARILAHALEVFGDDKDAQLWLKESKQALGGRTPLEMLASEPGAEQVDLMLSRIEHGIFA